MNMKRPAVNTLDKKYTPAKSGGFRIDYTWAEEVKLRCGSFSMSHKEAPGRGERQGS